MKQFYGTLECLHFQELPLGGILEKHDIKDKGKNNEKI